MLTLISYPAQFGEHSASPFCVKAMYALNASGLPWQREDTNDPRKMPLSKLPVLRTADGLIAGSDNIFAHVTKAGFDPDAGLTETQHVLSQALLRMTEEHLYFILVLDRWERDDVWPTTRDAYFHEIPGLLRGVVTKALRRKLLAGMNAQGLGRMGWPERMARARQDLDALAAQLGDGPFLMGDTARSVDTSVAPILSAIRATPVATDLTRLLGEYATLNAYIDRVDAAFGNGKPTV